jgi:hypothetical protein
VGAVHALEKVVADLDLDGLIDLQPNVRVHGVEASGSRARDSVDQLIRVVSPLVGGRAEVGVVHVSPEGSAFDIVFTVVVEVSPSIVDLLVTLLEEHHFVDFFLSTTLLEPVFGVLRSESLLTEYVVVSDGTGHVFINSIVTNFIKH